MPSITAAEIVSLDATDLAARIRTGELSSIAVVQAHIDRIRELNPKLNAVVTLVDGALEEAKKAEAEVKAGTAKLGPLHGVPFTVKDSIDTAGVPTQRASPIFAGRIPELDATAVARMKAAGAILLAKTNLPEFSYGIESDNLLTGRTNNPWNLDRTPGGSSGGESAAIAAGMSPIGLGTDLAISVRGPAAQTGIVALKATHGRVPMTGVWPREPRRFWHLGPMARSVRDLALAYEILAGPDGQDGFSSAFGSADVAGGVAKQGSLRIGWMNGPGFGPVDPEVRATVQAAAEAFKNMQFGHEVSEVRIPALERDFALDVFSRLFANEGKPGFAAATAGQTAEKLGQAVHDVREMPETSNADYIDAVQGAERLKDGFAAFFADHDALLMPVLPTPAHEHAAKDLHIDGETVGIFNVMAATSPFNVTGLPALSMRFGTSSEGLPIGVQIVGSWTEEATILQLASQLEAVSPVKSLQPKI
jgi:aspartyl-tRNA(Asn)/glutamyl-tRNA(Gln) amidotransferase subunit A